MTRVGMCMIVLLLFAVGCSHVKTVSGVETVTLDEITQNADEKALNLAGDGVIIHVKKGERIPVRFVVSLPFVALASGENHLVATEDVYLYVSRKAFSISRDGKHFAAVHDMKGLKKVYEFEQGHFQIGFGAGKEKPPEMTVGVSVR